MSFPKPHSFESLQFIKDGAILKRIEIDRIQWVHSDGNYITIHTLDQKFMLKMSLKKVCERLPSEMFVRVHRSYVVQTYLIERIDFQENEIHLKGSNVLPLGRGYKNELMEKINLLN